MRNARTLLIGMLSLALAGAGACDRGESGGDGGWFGGRASAAGTSVAEASLDDAGRLRFEVTSDIYRRWTVAQQALGRSAIARSMSQLGRRALTQQELDAAVAKVEGDAAARTAVQNAGMSPLEYVYATVAIGQAMAVARGELAPRRDDGGVGARNAELARQNEAEITASSGGSDSAGDALPPDYGPVPPPEPTPVPPIASAPVPRDSVASPRDTAPPVPLPTPRPATPQPVPTQPVPAPTQPVPARPTPTQPSPVPQPAPPPVDTMRATGP